MKKGLKVAEKGALSKDAFLPKTVPGLSSTLHPKEDKIDCILMG